MLRNKVLRAFKDLHRTSQEVFNGDSVALKAARLKINEEFRKNKHVENASSIEEMVKFAQAVEVELKTTVVQAVEQKPGVYEMKLRKDVQRLENYPFDENAVLPTRSKGKKCKPE